MKSCLSRIPIVYLLILALCILLTLTGRAQQNLCGTTLNDVFTKVIEHPVTGDLYILASTQLTAGGLRHATITIADPQGNLLGFTTTVDIPSQWNDAVLTPNGDLMLVGHTLPYDNTNQSLIGKYIFTTKDLNWVSRYDMPNQETYAQIVLNPIPQNPLYPYYVLGKYLVNPATGDDNVVMLNIDENGNVSWKNILSTSDDDEFTNDLEVFTNGDLLVAGNIGNRGVVLQLDNAGTPYNGLTPAGQQLSFSDVYYSGGNVYCLANTVPSSLSYVLKFDATFFPLWEREYSDLTAMNELWIDPSTSDLFITGSGLYNSLVRPVVLRFFEFNGLFINWLNYLDHGETAYEGGSTTQLASGNIAYVDGRVPTINGLGLSDGFLSLTDIDMVNSCMTFTDYADSLGTQFLYEGPELPVAIPDVAVAFSESWSPAAWIFEDACDTTNTCIAAFTFSLLGNCGNVQFTDNSSSSNTIVQYCWDFDGIPGCESVSQNPTWQFAGPPCQSHQVCLTITDVSGCTDTYCDIVIVADNIPPVITCPPDQTLSCDDDISTPTTGFATAIENCPQPPTILFSDVSFGNIPCNGLIERTWTATDQCGNSSTCVQILSIVDNIPPVIVNCPPDVTINVSGTSSQCSAFVLIPIPTATDHCAPPVTLTNDYNGSGDASDSYNNGTTVVTWTATDACGNSATCIFNITILCIPDSCQCLGFEDFSFYWGNGLVGWEIGMSCPNTGIAILPCIPSGELYRFKGNLLCSDSCTTSVNYDLISLNTNLSVGSGTVPITYIGNNTSQFDLTSGFNPAPGLYQLALSGHCGTDSCLCLIDLFVPYCDTCYCETYSDISADWGGAITETAVCGDTLVVPAGLSLTLDASFLCLGNECDTATVLCWDLVGPAGSVLTGCEVAMPNFSIHVPDAVFVNGPIGIYELKLETFCGSDTCVCSIYFNVTFCGSIIQFEEDVEQAIDIATDSTDCSATVHIGALSDNIYIDHIAWGDGGISTGPIYANGTISHFYAEDGEYEITYVAIGLDSTDQFCQGRAFSQVIYPDCLIAPCCLGPANMLFSPVAGTGTQSVSCGDAYALQCIPGTTYSITGFFDCTCTSTAQLSWQLFDPNGTLLVNNAILTTPYFIISIPSSYFYLNGAYTIQINGICGNAICAPCPIYIDVSIPCPDPCPCDPLQFMQDVNKGFLQILNLSNPCQRCFKPLGLTQCDTVQWYIGTSPVGTPTIGNQWFCYTFPLSGTYSISMVVNRKKGINQFCEVEDYSKTITVNCGFVPYPDCWKPKVYNVGFDSLSVPGILGADGTTANWVTVSGTPRIDTAQNTLDGWFVELAGNADVFDAIRTEEEICLDEDSMSVNLLLRSLDYRPGEQLVVRLIRDGLDFLPDSCLGDQDCFEIFRLELPETSGEWFTLEQGYRLSSSVLNENCEPQPGILYRPVIYVTNSLREVQGPDVDSHVQIDNFCLELHSTVAVEATYSTKALRVYPNPNNGEFSVDLSELGSGGDALQIISLTGQLMSETQIDTKAIQDIHANNLAEGMYFLQVLSNGRQIAVGKFVKK